jgi:hypothetical protein
MPWSLAKQNSVRCTPTWVSRSHPMGLRMGGRGLFVVVLVVVATMVVEVG